MSLSSSSLAAEADPAKPAVMTGAAYLHSVGFAPLERKTRRPHHKSDRAGGRASPRGPDCQGGGGAAHGYLRPRARISRDCRSRRLVQTAGTTARVCPSSAYMGGPKNRRAQMLRDIDVLVFDIQDVGVRFYTYISTMGLAMQAAAERGIPFFVWTGRTLSAASRCRIRARSGAEVVRRPVSNSHRAWTDGGRIGANDPRGTLARQSGTLAAHSGRDEGVEPRYALAGGLICRGSPPAPISRHSRRHWSIPASASSAKPSSTKAVARRYRSRNSARLGSRPKKSAGHLNDLRLPGVRFEATRYTPRSIPNVAEHPRFEGQEIQGIRLAITDANAYRPLDVGATFSRTCRAFAELGAYHCSTS